MSRLAKRQMHCWLQKSCQRTKWRQNRGELRAASRIIIAPESSFEVPISTQELPKYKDIFIEKCISQDPNQQQFFGSPDTLISSEQPFLHISNFSDSPIVISKGQIIGRAHNARN